MAQELFQQHYKEIGWINELSELSFLSSSVSTDLTKNKYKNALNMKLNSKWNLV